MTIMMMLMTMVLMMMMMMMVMAMVMTLMLMVMMVMMLMMIFLLRGATSSSALATTDRQVRLAGTARGRCAFAGLIIRPGHLAGPAGASDSPGPNTSPRWTVLSPGTASKSHQAMQHWPRQASR